MSKTEGITIDHFSGSEGLARLRDAWTQVTRDPVCSHFYQSWEWYSCWLKWLETDHERFHFFLFRREASPLAIFPLREAQVSLGGIKLSALSPPAHDHFLLADVVCRTDALSLPLWQLLFDYLNTNGFPCDVIAMHRMLPDGNAVSLLANFPEALVQKRQESGCDYILTDETDFAAYQAGLSKNFRRSLKRARKDLAESYADRFEFTFAEGETDLDRRLTDFFRVEASGWKGDAGSAISQDSQLTNFYRELAVACARLGKTIVGSMEIEKKCVAGQLTLSSGGEVYMLKVGYDEKYRNIAPGKLLMAEFIEKCFADPKIRRINLVTDDPWHEDWEIKRKMKVRSYIFNKTARGRVAFWAMNIYGTKIRRLLPEGIRRRVIPVVSSRKSASTKSP